MVHGLSCMWDLPRSGIEPMTEPPGKPLLDCFPKWLYRSTFPLAGCERSSYFTSSPTLVFICLLVIALIGSMRYYFIVILQFSDN